MFCIVFSFSSHYLNNIIFYRQYFGTSSDRITLYNRRENCTLNSLITCRRFGTTYRANMPRSRIQELLLLGFLILEYRTDRWSQNLVKNYHYYLCNIPEERSSNVLRGGILKSRMRLTISMSLHVEILKLFIRLNYFNVQ